MLCMDKMLMFMILLVAIGGSAAGQCVDDRWFAVGALRGASHVMGPFKTLAECEDARKKEAFKFAVLHEWEIRKLPGLRDRVLSAAKEGPYRERLAQADADGHAVAADEYKGLAFLWTGGSVCERR